MGILLDGIKEEVMGLNEKANGKFGGMIKITNTKTVPGDSAKKSNYDKEYHYASSAGTKSPMSGGKGPSKQHDGEYMAKWRHVSDKFTKSDMAKGPKKLGGQHTTTEGIKYFKASEC